MGVLESNRAGRLVILLAAALTLGLVALTSATASNGDVPFKARVSGSAAFTSPTTVEFHGAGQADTWSVRRQRRRNPRTAHRGLPRRRAGHPERAHRDADSGQRRRARNPDGQCGLPDRAVHLPRHRPLDRPRRDRTLPGCDRSGTNEGNADSETNTFSLSLTGRSPIAEQPTRR